MSHMHGHAHIHAADGFVCVWYVGGSRNSQTFIGREAVGEKRTVLVLHFCQSETEKASERKENVVLPSTR